MDVSESQLRTLVADAVARHSRRGIVAVPTDACREHASHGLLTLVRGAGTGEACLIEPAVRCHHCGYCQSYGH